MGLKEEKESDQAQQTKDNDDLSLSSFLPFAFFLFPQGFLVEHNLLFSLKFSPGASRPEHSYITQGDWKKQQGDSRIWEDGKDRKPPARGERQRLMRLFF